MLVPPIKTAFRAAAMLGLVASSISMSGTPVAATESDSLPHCISDIVGKTAEGDFILGPRSCYATYAEVLESHGNQNVSRSITPQSVTPATLLGSGIIGTHYDGAGFHNASFSVGGTDCSGGGFNVALDWNDRISSTANGCPRIVHYENTNYGGATFATTGSGGDVSGYMDNRTSSIRYFAS